MKTMRSLRIVSLFILLITGFSVSQKVQAQPGANISFQTFYNDLAPYGRWTTSREYGSVWSPNVDRDFQPYSTNGYWEVTEYGNTWVSDYDWGWAPFHYGRWSYTDYDGWFWIPGYEWGPAWVNWRSGGEYYGWAPLGPGMNINVSINIPSFWWVFVPQRYISNRYWHNYSAPRGRVTHIYNQTTIINNYYRNDNRSYVYGPRRDEIERVTRRSVPVRRIDVSQRGRVITDRSSARSNGTYAPDRGRPGYNTSRQPAQGRESNDRGRVYNDNPGANRNSGLNNRNRDNGNNNPVRSGSERSVPNTGSNSRNRESNVPAQVPSENRNRGSYENARPAAEPRAERSSPTYNAEPNSRSSRQADNGSQNNARTAPAARPTEQRSAPQRSERSTESNAGGSERSSGRSSRGPR